MSRADASGRSDDTRLAQLAARQHGVVGLAQLRELDYTERMVATRLRAGRLHRLYAGVYAVGHRRISSDGRRLAAVLACGPAARLSHRDAARLHGLLRGVGSGPIEVVAPARRRIPGIRCHVSRNPDPRDATVVNGIPVTSWARTALDLAATLPRPRVRDALELAERLGLFDLAVIEDLLARTPGHHGLPTLRAVLAELEDSPPALRSGLEADFLALVRSAGLPEPQTNVVIAGEVADFCWPDARLVVEVDGWLWHRLRRDFEANRRRDVALTLAGYRVVRFTDIRIADDAAAVVAEVQALLALGAG